MPKNLSGNLISDCLQCKFTCNSGVTLAGSSCKCACQWCGLTCWPSVVSMETRYASLKSGRPNDRSLFRYSLSWLVSRNTLVMLLRKNRVVLTCTCALLIGVQPHLTVDSMMSVDKIIAVLVEEGRGVS